MDTVTEGEMAIAMAREGGLGIIHRFMTIEQQVAEVGKVKSSRTWPIARPCLTVDVAWTIDHVLGMVGLEDCSGLLVVDADDTPTGVVPIEAIDSTCPLDSKVSELMIQLHNLVTVQADELVEAGVQSNIAAGNSVILLQEGDILLGLIKPAELSALCSNPISATDSDNRLLVGATIGVRDTDEALARAAALISSDVDALTIDIAHGHSDSVIDLLILIKQRWPDVQVIAGNVATAAATRDLIDAGADVILVGVGPGSACTTRNVTGVGVPQLTAVLECSETARAAGVPIIANGGVTVSGDITKALGAGASSVMLGHLLAGTDESPGGIIHRDGGRFKTFRGMASLAATQARKRSEAAGNAERNGRSPEREVARSPEGVAGWVPYRGSVGLVLKQLAGGVRSGMSYCNARNIPELQSKVQFTKVSYASLHENGSHDILPLHD